MVYNFGSEKNEIEPYSPISFGLNGKFGMCRKQST